MKAVAFDLGDTLVEYAGLPASWEAYYDAALKKLAEYVGCNVSDQELNLGRETLRKYNTRLNPRTREVPFSAILEDLMQSFRVKTEPDVEAAAGVFFSVFRQRLRCFPETKPVLSSLRSAKVRIGVLTDVPYGMPRALVAEDMLAAGVFDLIDELVTPPMPIFVSPSQPASNCWHCVLRALHWKCSLSETRERMWRWRSRLGARRCFWTDSVLVRAGGSIVQ